MQKKKLYALVDKNLSRSQQAVQAAHAVAQYLLENPDTEWANGTLVLLKTEINEFIPYADSYFMEPDMNNKITALTFLGNDDKVKNLRLI